MWCLHFCSMRTDHITQFLSGKQHLKVHWTGLDPKNSQLRLKSCSLSSPNAFVCLRPKWGVREVDLVVCWHDSIARVNKLPPFLVARKLCKRVLACVGRFSKVRRVTVWLEWTIFPVLIEAQTGCWTFRTVTSGDWTTGISESWSPCYRRRLVLPTFRTPARWLTLMPPFTPFALLTGIPMPDTNHW